MNLNRLKLSDGTAVIPAWTIIVSYLLWWLFFLARSQFGGFPQSDSLFGCHGSTLCYLFWTAFVLVGVVFIPLQLLRRRFLGAVFAIGLNVSAIYNQFFPLPLLDGTRPTSGMTIVFIAALLPAIYGLYLGLRRR